jgi:hypothetical protein
MSTAGIQVLISLSGAAPAPARNESTGMLADDPESNQQFAQLLNDSGTQGEHAASEHLLKGQLAAVSNATSVLTAQELGDADPAVATNAWLTESQHEIDAEQATALINKIDTWLNFRDRDPSQDTPRGQVMELLARFEGMARIHGKQVEAKEALEQLRQQLQMIRDSGEPKKLGDILSFIPAIAGSKGMMAGLANLLMPGRANKKTEEAPSTTANAVASLPATLFRTDDGEVAPAKVAASGDEEKEALNLSMDVPASAVVYQPLAFVQEVSASATQTDYAPIRIRGDLDQAVPPLTLSDDNALGSLPELDLPVLGVRDAVAGNAAEKFATPVRDTMPTMNSAAAAMSAITPDAVKPGKMTEAAQSDITVNTNDFGSLVGNAPGGHQAQTARAPAPVAHVPMMPQQMNRAPVNEQVQVAIAQASKDGLSRITIQLDPLDLGRIEVNMVTQADGRSQISFMVDKAETFDGLSRDARVLERSLQEAGIKADAGSMQFNLRQQPQPQMQSDAGGQGQSGQPGNTPQEEQQTQRSAEVIPVAAFTRNYTVNIRDGVDISA